MKRKGIKIIAAVLLLIIAAIPVYLDAKKYNEKQNQEFASEFEQNYNKLCQAIRLYSFNNDGKIPQQLSDLTDYVIEEAYQTPRGAKYDFNASEHTCTLNASFLDANHTYEYLPDTLQVDVQQ